ncbi:Uncharacterized protein Fot_46012 [Forsythia ovata]|uniref:Uncharacterized protein n=1 Tax=Forsythia ovata TaxID=205694 RepID=A0ABD1QLJ6_9LAMI
MEPLSLSLYMQFGLEPLFIYISRCTYTVYSCSQCIMLKGADLQHSETPCPPVLKFREKMVLAIVHAGTETHGAECRRPPTFSELKEEENERLHSRKNAWSHKVKRMKMLVFITILLEKAIFLIVY